MRASGTGPRSFTRTMIDRRLPRLVTRSKVPIGSVRVSAGKHVEVESFAAGCFAPLKLMAVPRSFADLIPLWFRLLHDGATLRIVRGVIARVCLSHQATDSR